jgi:hypothetical protein
MAEIYFFEDLTVGLTAKFSSTPKLSGQNLIRAFESDLQIVAQHLRGMGKGSV